ncbi:MAG: hypothetical protein GXO16_03145 [Epsilonproteobacteria bacterium]|nr:hypothetical protein [Campylobacterota bacterium]
MRIELQGLNELKNFFKKLPKRSSCDFLMFMAEKTYRYAKKYAGEHHRTGKMEHNIELAFSCDKKGKSTAIIEVTDDGMLVDWKGKKVNYAWFVHEGTSPHFIHPKFKKALRWTKDMDVKSEFAFAKAVRHPGYKGDPFLARALEKGSSEAMRYFGRFVDGS